MIPKTLALVDDDTEYSEFLAQYLRGEGIAVTVYSDSDDLLIARGVAEFDFYVLDLMLPGVDGLELIRILRKRSRAGIVVVSGRLSPSVFKDIVTAGADMYLAKPVQFEQVLLAIKAVQRRAAPGDTAQAPWLMDIRARELIAPDGVRVSLSESDRTVLECFVDAKGEAVERETILLRLGRETHSDGVADGLNAIIFRLRRRIERATSTPVPLQSKSRVGYVFKAPLEVI